MWRCLVMLAVAVSAGRRRGRTHLDGSESIGSKDSEWYLRYRGERIEERPETMKLHVKSNIINRYAITEVEMHIFNPKKENQMGEFVVVMPATALVSDISLRGERFLMQRNIEDGSIGSNVDGFKGIFVSPKNVKSSPVEMKFREFILPVLMIPFENVSFNIVYEELLSRKSGKYQYSLNLDVGEVIPDFAVRIEIRDQSNITGVVVTSPVIGDTTIEALKEYANQKEKTIEFDMTVQEQAYYFGSHGFSGNLLTEYDVSTNENKVDIAVKEGYFVYFYNGPDNLPPISKHIMLVVDNSITLEEGFLTSSELAIKIIQSLNEKDYLNINIMPFNGSVLEWNPFNKLGRSTVQQAFKCQPHTKESALQFIRGLQREEFSDIISTLQTAVFIGQRIKLSESLPDNVLSIMLIITDNAEISKTKDENLTSIHPDTVYFPIFSLTIGYYSQPKVLNIFSKMTGQSFYNIDPTENIDDQLQLILMQFDDVLLKNVKISFVSELVHKDSLTKTEYDYFNKGTNLVAAGKFNNTMNGTIEAVISGQCFNKTYIREEHVFINSSLVTAVKFNGSRHEENVKSTNYINRIWTYMKIREAMSYYNHNNSYSNPETVVNLSMTHNFLTPFTQFVLEKNNTWNILKYNKEAINLEDFDDLSNKNMKIQEGTCESNLTLISFNGKHLTLTSSNPMVHLVGITYVRKTPEEAFCCWILYTEPYYRGRTEKLCGRYGPVNLHQVKSVGKM